MPYQYTSLGQGYCNDYWGQLYKGSSIEHCAERCFITNECTGFAVFNEECLLSKTGCKLRTINSKFWWGYALSRVGLGGGYYKCTDECGSASDGVW